MHRRHLIAAALLATLAPPAAADQPLRVVTSFSILGDLVRQVGGDRVAVASLVGPDGDAHAFEPTPADAKALAEADLVVVNGLGFEGWIDRLVAASGYRGPVATASDGVTPRTPAEHAHEEEHEEHAAGEPEEHAADEHEHGDTDPHAWQDLRNGRRYVENIAEALARADPPRADAYAAAAACYLARVDVTDAWVRAEIAKVPAAQRKVVTSHDAFGYFGAAYGVRFVAAEGATEDAEPSAAAIAALIDQIRDERIKVVFLENALSSRLVSRIAQETGARIGGMLNTDALSPPGGDADSYLGMFRRNVPLLRDAMLASAVQG